MCLANVDIYPVYQIQVWTFCKRSEAVVRGCQCWQEPLGEQPWSLRQVKFKKWKKAVEVHQVQVFHLRACVFFLEGEAWTAEGHANIQQKNRNAVIFSDSVSLSYYWMFPCTVGVNASVNGRLSMWPSDKLATCQMTAGICSSGPNNPSRNRKAVTVNGLMHVIVEVWQMFVLVQK